MKGVIFGKAWRKFRRIRSVSSQELAEKLGVSHGYVQAVENGNEPPFSPDRIVQAVGILEPDGAYSAQTFQILARWDRAVRVIEPDPDTLKVLIVLADRIARGYPLGGLDQKLLVLLG